MSQFKNFLKWALTFVVVCLAWIFFRANSLGDSFMITKGVLTDFSVQESIETLGLALSEFKLSLVLIVLLVLFDWIHRKYGALKLLNKTPWVMRSALYAIIVLSIFVFGIYGSDNVSEFIYFQF